MGPPAARFSTSPEVTLCRASRGLSASRRRPRQPFTATTRTSDVPGAGAVRADETAAGLPADADLVNRYTGSWPLPADRRRHVRSQAHLQSPDRRTRRSRSLTRPGKVAVRGTIPLNKRREPKDPPPDNSLAKLAEFTKRILRVPKDDVQDSDKSTWDGRPRATDPGPE
jgi:hypothetical protein